MAVVALQAQYPERLTASSVVFTVCSLVGKDQPLEEIFGLREVQYALRRIGAALQSRVFLFRKAVL